MSTPKVKALIAISDPEAAANVALVLAHRSISAPLLVSTTFDAVDAMIEDSFNLFFVDASIPMTSDRPGLDGGIDFVRFIRMCDGAVSEAVIVFLRSKVGDINMLEVRDEIVTVEDAGANCIIGQPLTLKSFDEVIAPELGNPRLFLRADSYTGPCRRRLQEAIDIERRGND